MIKLDEIQVELTGICNASCSYCTWQKREKGKQNMDKALAIRILQEARDMAVRSVRYHGLGESTIHPHLIEIMNAGENLSFDHSISTNCYILKNKLAEEMKEIAGLSVILAIPWVMHDKFVNICVNNAIDYLSTKSKNKRIHVQMVCHESAEVYYKKAIDIFLPFVERRENAFLHLKQPVTWYNDTPNVGFINREYANHPKVLFDDRVTPVSIAQGCNMPNRFLMILADGTVVPCCVGMSEWGLGTIVDRTLKEVWESPQMEEIRMKWQNSDESIPCGHCKKRTDCLQ